MVLIHGLSQGCKLDLTEQRSYQPPERINEIILPIKSEIPSIKLSTNFLLSSPRLITTSIHFLKFTKFSRLNKKKGPLLGPLFFYYEYSLKDYFLVQVAASAAFPEKICPAYFPFPVLVAESSNLLSWPSTSSDKAIIRSETY